VHELLRGEILAIGLHEFETLAVVLTLVLGVVIVAHRDLVLISYDRESALVLGKPVFAWEMLLQFITGATIATGVMTVGPVLLFGLLVLPPLAARTLTQSMTGFFVWSAFLGVLSAVIGLYGSFRYDLPLGPAVVLGGALIALLVKPLEWWRARN
jgi:manganese/iron transport system permease protein